MLIADLNYNVAIVAHFLVPECLPSDVTLMQLLNGQSDGSSPDGRSGEDRINIIDHLVSASKSLLEKRMLFTMDVYCHSGCEEIMINRAYLIDR